jgi:hypothetical protein
VFIFHIKSGPFLVIQMLQAAIPGQLNAGDVAAVLRGDLQALRKSCAGGIASCTYSLEKPGTE